MNITSRKAAIAIMQDDFRNIIESVDNLNGDDFFETICLQLHHIIAADYTFIARFDMERFVSKTVKLINHGEVVDNFEYSLEHTPCADLMGEPVCTYPADVASKFPQDKLLIDMKVQGYVGAALTNSKGQVFGLVTALYEQEIKEPVRTQTLLQVFSGRIASELERCEYEQSLLELNNSLETKVQERTQQLKTAISDLELAQAQLIESEKMAALGNLVAGIAHEVNTPLGVAITAQSHLREKSKDLRKQFEQEKMRKTDLRGFLSICDESLQMIESNLQRAELLINNFKKVSADQSVFEIQSTNLKQYYTTVIESLKPILKNLGTGVHLDCPDTFSAETCPGAHAQVLSNLCQNAVSHGFTKETYPEAHINISIREKDTGYLVTFSDNGSGIEEQNKPRIFDPFFTTNRQGGGTGLGLSICYNLISQTLQGWIKLVQDDKPGTRFEYWFPKAIKSDQ